MLSLSSTQAGQLLESFPSGAIIHLVGAGGCGMSGLGHLLLDLGFKVTGSDLAPNEDTRELAARGTRIFDGHAGAHIRDVRPLLVAYSSAIRRENPELQAAEELQIPTVRRAMLLAALVHRQQGICVAGMHGKTTTSALLAFALENLAANPSYAVGARVPQLRRHARLQTGGGGDDSRGRDRPAEPGHGGGDRGGAAAPGPGPGPGGESVAAAGGTWFVAEVDESDGTLAEFQPVHSIVLNLDAEHLDFYANLEAIYRAFDTFASNTREAVLFCADDPRLAELFSRRARVVSYGFHPLADYRLVPKPAPNEPGGFEVWHAGAALGRFATRLMGEKNISNAGAVVALLHRLGYPAPAIARAIAEFRGAARRQELLFEDARFRVYDDYGHHPAEVAATLQAFKALGGRRLLVAFQPHRFSRTQHLLEEFAGSFRDADRLWVADIYAASEAAIPGIDSGRLAEAMRARGRPVEHIGELCALRRAVRAAMLPGDVVLFLGAGDITQAAHQLAAELREENVMPSETLLAELTGRLSPETVLKPNEPLARRTTMRVGGKADILAEPASEEDLSRLVAWCAERSVKFTLLGRGSNLLIRDGGIRGVVICLAHPRFSRLEIVGDRLHCGAGVRLKAVAVEARRAGLTGLEFLEGIPGTVGGSMRMNAGAMGSWFFDVIERIRFMDYTGHVHERPAAEVNVEYRGCPLLRNHIGLGAVLKGVSAPPETIATRMQQYSEKRWESQPAAPSAGCIFKNPRAVPAGKLIDELGLKGTRVGGASVSDVHGNFIINDGTATAKDVLALIDVIKDRARTARGIELETEVEILGELE